MTDSASPTPTSPAQRLGLVAGIVVFLLGPICVLGSTPISGYINKITNYQAGLIPFFTLGFIYGLVILVALGLGIFGLFKSRRAAKPRKVLLMSIIGLVLSMLSLCCLLVIWGSFAVLPCGVFGC
jgi:hypothetical protein